MQYLLVPLRNIKQRFKLASQHRRLRAPRDGRSARLVIGTSRMGMSQWVGTDREAPDHTDAHTWERFLR
jgi:hypothetical protein